MVPVRSLPLAALITLIAAPTFAQSGGGYDVTWYTVDGGGITYCTSTDYKVGGTVGQPDAGSVSGEAVVRPTGKNHQVRQRLLIMRLLRIMVDWLAKPRVGSAWAALV